MITIRKSKQIFFNFLKNQCDEFKHVKFFYNDMFITMQNQKYFTLKFTNENVELHEREYLVNGSKKIQLVRVFPIQPTMDQLIFMREKFLQ